jgi:hypothetical protein
MCAESAYGAMPLAYNWLLSELDSTKEKGQDSGKRTL